MAYRFDPMNPFEAKPADGDVNQRKMADKK